MPKSWMIVTLCLLLELVSMPASGWGWETHKLICGLAEKKLTPKAKDNVHLWLSQSEELEGGITDFPKACLWPDMVKHTTRKDTYKHHFINVPDDAYSIQLGRDCLATECLATGIRKALKELSSNPADQAAVSRRAAALRFLGHYIGDLHQPLHVGNASDWGGNKISVNWRGKKTNLHALWDYEMPEAAGLKYPQSVNHISMIDAEFDETTIEDWFNESLLLARGQAYGSVSGGDLTSGSTISNEYFDRSRSIITERIGLAAARLAYLLNEISEGKKISTFRVMKFQP